MDENKYLTRFIEEKPAPNERQWSNLMRAVNARLTSFAYDKERDPADDVMSDSVLTFAATLPSHMGYEIVTHWNDKLAKILLARESGRKFASQFTDEELQRPPGEYHIPYTANQLRDTVACTAAGMSKQSYHRQGGYYSSNLGAVNPEVIEKAKRHAEQFAHIYQYPDLKELPLPGEQWLWDLSRRYYSGRKNYVKAPYEQFSRAMYSLKEEIRKKDDLFSSKFEHWIARDLAKADFERLRQPLTKPLDDYAWHPDYYGPNRRSGYNYGREYNREYSHKGAQAAYDARNRIEREQEYIDGIDAIIGDPLSLSVEDTIQNAEVWAAAYQAALEKDQIEQRKREAKKAAATKEQEELMAKPVVVEAVEREDGTVAIDHRALKKGLVKRKGYIVIKSVAIPITRLRQWLTIVLKDPATNRVFRDFGQGDWMAVQRVGSVMLATKMDATAGPALVFTLPKQGTMKAQTTFLGIDFAYRPDYMHVVEFDIVEEDRIKVWTPDLINRLKPIVAQEHCLHPQPA